MEKLKLFDLYENNDRKIPEEFIGKVNSSLHVKTDYKKVEVDAEWLEMFELCIPYVENIYRNPNRFIINEEEVVKIELARKITVESIKHLSRNTNLIQDVDEKTGDVTPSKILNINKEESFNTYENRVIYTLIQNAKYFVHKKKEELLQEQFGGEKNDKLLDYNGSVKVLNEDVNINIKLSTGLSEKQEKGKSNNLDDILARIQKIEERLRDFSSLETYKSIDKLHITLVRPPIRKTNLILKNTNFQYAMRLWTFLQDHLDDDDIRKIDEKQDYMDEHNLKTFVDENFLLNYLVIRTLDPKYEESLKSEEEIKKIKEQLTDSMLDQILALNEDLSKEKLEEMIGNKYTIIKYKNLSSIAEIQKVFKKYMDKYLKQINEGV